MTKKEKLIEKLGVHIECKEQLAPLAARILSTLILSGRQGITFDGLVSDLKASKSTISTHLSTLQAANRVTYYTKSGDRKKYFILIPDAMIQSMTQMMQKWKTERDLHVEIMEYKQEINDTLPDGSSEKFDLEFHTDYLTFLNHTIDSVARLRDKLTEKHKNH